MLPKMQRIPKFVLPSMFRHGRRFRGVSVMLFFRPSQMSSRATIVSPRKLHKTAVARNRTKRIIAESMANILPGIRSMDIVVRALTDFSALKQPEAESLVRKDLIASGLLADTRL